MKNEKSIFNFYPNLFEINGSVLDEESYHKHFAQKQRTNFQKASSMSSVSKNSFSLPTSGSFHGSGFYGGYGLQLI